MAREVNWGSFYGEIEDKKNKSSEISWSLIKRKAENSKSKKWRKQALACRYLAHQRPPSEVKSSWLITPEVRITMHLMKLYIWFVTIDQKPYLTNIICGLHFITLQSLLKRKAENSKSKKWRKQALARRYLARQRPPSEGQGFPKDRKGESRCFQPYFQALLLAFSQLWKITMNSQLPIVR